MKRRAISMLMLWEVGNRGELLAETQILSDKKPAGVRNTRLVSALQPR